MRGWLGGPELLGSGPAGCASMPKGLQASTDRGLAQCPPDIWAVPCLTGPFLTPGSLDGCQTMPGPPFSPLVQGAPRPPITPWPPLLTLLPSLATPGRAPGLPSVGALRTCRVGAGGGRSSTSSSRGSDSSSERKPSRNSSISSSVSTVCGRPPGHSASSARRQPSRGAPRTAAMAAARVGGGGLREGLRGLWGRRGGRAFLGAGGSSELRPRVARSGADRPLLSSGGAGASGLPEPAPQPPGRRRSRAWMEGLRGGPEQSRAPCTWPFPKWGLGAMFRAGGPHLG